MCYAVLPQNNDRAELRTLSWLSYSILTLLFSE